MSWFTDYSLAEMESMMDWVYQHSQGQGGSSASLIHQASLTLNNADILGLVGQPVQIASGPGSNRQFIIYDVALVPRLQQPYTSLGANQARIRRGSDQLAFVMNANEGWNQVLDDVLAGTVAAFTPFAYGTHAFGFITSISTASVWTNNDPLEVYIQGDGYTDGDAANEVLLNIAFFVYDAALNKRLTTTESGWNESTRTFE